MAALWAAQRQKKRRIVYCFNILIDFVLQYTIQRACQNMKGIDYQRCDILALVRECKETLQRGVKEIDRVMGSRGSWNEVGKLQILVKIHSNFESLISR